MKVSRRSALSMLAAVGAVSPVGIEMGRVSAASITPLSERDDRGKLLHEDAEWVPASDVGFHQWRVRVLSPAYRRNTQEISASLGVAKGSADLVRQIFYGDSWSRTTEMTGLERYFGSATLGSAQNAVNVIDAKGKSERRSSIYVVTWAERTVYLAHAGDRRSVALIPHDWRYIARVANVDAESDVETLTARALLRLPRVAVSSGDVGTRLRIYCGPQIGNRLGLKFRQIPVRVIPDLHDHESLVI